MLVSFKYKGEELEFKVRDILFLTDLTFAFIIFFWYIIYKFGYLQDYSPLLAIILSLIQNIIILIIMIVKKSSFGKIFKYIVLSIIIKVIAILSFYPNNFIIGFKDFFVIVYLYIIYIIIVILIAEIFEINYNIETLVYDDLTGIGSEKTPNAKVSSVTYDSLMDVILSYGNSINKN